MPEKSHANKDFIGLHLIQFVILIILLVIENADIFSWVLALAVSVIYVFAAHHFSESQKISGIRNIGIGVIFFIAFTVLAILFPFRPLNLIAVFMVLDVLVKLIPGGLFSGKSFWEWSKALYIITLVLGLGFLVVNLLNVPLEWLVFFFTHFSVVVFVGLLLFILAVIILGLLGKKVVRD